MSAEHEKMHISEMVVVLEVNTARPPGWGEGSVFHKSCCALHVQCRKTVAFACVVFP